MAINRCQNCKIGTSFCVYTKTVEVETQYGKKYMDVPSKNCILGKEDEYAIFPDTEDVNFNGIDLLNPRLCEAELFMDPFISNKYLYEALTNNVTTGDMYNIDSSYNEFRKTQSYELKTDSDGKVIVNSQGKPTIKYHLTKDGNPLLVDKKMKVTGPKRYDYDHPMYHIIDYNVPLNTTGVVRLHEQCYVMGKKDISLESKNWVTDDFGEAKKAIGIPKVRQCFGLYGTFNKATGLIMHKSMYDQTKHMPSFKNYTVVKVNQYQDAFYNIFTSEFKDINDHINNIGLENECKVRLYEAYALIKKGKYINLYSLLLNNNVEQQDVFKILNTVSIKNPKTIYKNNQGNRYSIKKIKELYFNIVDDTIDAGINKELMLANIVNYVLNDKTLLNHIVGLTPKKLQYNIWFDMIKHDLDEEEFDTLRPERFNVNEYNQDNNIGDFIKIITHAIYAQKLLAIDNLPEEFKGTIKRYNDYLGYFDEPKDVEDIGAATSNIKELLNISEEQQEIYDSFVILITNLLTISPYEITELWRVYHKAMLTNNSIMFWEYVDVLVDDYNNVGQKLIEIKISSDTFDIIDFTESHSNYIRSKNKRYYNKDNQENEHSKLYNEDEDLSNQFNEFNMFEESL